MRPTEARPTSRGPFTALRLSRRASDPKPDLARGFAGAVTRRTGRIGRSSRLQPANRSGRPPRTRPAPLGPGHGARSPQGLRRFFHERDPFGGVEPGTKLRRRLRTAAREPIPLFRSAAHVGHAADRCGAHAPTGLIRGPLARVRSDGRPGRAGQRPPWPRAARWWRLGIHSRRSSG